MATQEMTIKQREKHYLIICENKGCEKVFVLFDVVKRGKKNGLELEQRTDYYFNEEKYIKTYCPYCGKLTSGKSKTSRKKVKKVS